MTDSTHEFTEPEDIIKNTLLPLLDDISNAYLQKGNRHPEHDDTYTDASLWWIAEQVKIEEHMEMLKKATEDKT